MEAPRKSLGLDQTSKTVENWASVRVVTRSYELGTMDGQSSRRRTITKASPNIANQNGCQSMLQPIHATHFRPGPKKGIAQAYKGHSPGLIGLCPFCARA